MTDTLFLQHIISNIVLHSTAVAIQRSEDQRGVLFRVSVHKDDMPRVIGRQGRNVAALRVILSAFVKNDQHLALIVEEPRS